MLPGCMSPPSMRGSCRVSVLRSCAVFMLASSSHRTDSWWWQPALSNRTRGRNPWSSHPSPYLVLWPVPARCAGSTASFSGETGRQLHSQPRRAWQDRCRVLETLRYGLGREHTTSAGPDQFSNDPPEEAELLAIAVTDRSRRHGAGAALVGAFLSTAAQMGPPSARVIVDAANHGAIALYDRAGFSIAGGLEIHAGTQSVLMRVQLSQPNAS